jgi:hypothetical protein
MLEKLKARFKEWRRKRLWNEKEQLYHLRVMVMADNRWMAHNPIVSELTDRYLRMLSDTWEIQPQESVERFRERIGLDPHKRSNAELRGATRLYRGASRLSDGLAGKT